MPYGRGFGFRGYSPPWPYVGLGRGGLRRCWAFGHWGAPPYYGPYPPYGVPTRREDELNFLKDEMDFLRQEMEAIDARIKELEREEQ